MRMARSTLQRLVNTGSARGTIGSQLAVLRARVAAEGHELSAEFCDDGYSGARLDRPGLDALRDAAEAGLIEPPFLVQSIFGVMGGIGADPENVFMMRQTADRLFGKDYVWSLFAAGRHQMPFITMGAVMGASVRVGLEDSLYLAKGRLAASNAEQVAKIRRILEELSLDVASPDDARQVLHLKGRTHVGF